jgi:hypothetical protein
MPERFIRQFLEANPRGLVWILWAPTRLAIALVRLWSARAFFRDAFSCPTCGAEIRLLGLWTCGSCGYSFYGFFFSRCPVCRDIPPYIDCWLCGASTMYPLAPG